MSGSSPDDSNGRHLTLIYYVMLGIGPTLSSLSPDHTPSSTSARASKCCCRLRIDRLFYTKAGWYTGINSLLLVDIV